LGEKGWGYRYQAFFKHVKCRLSSRSSSVSVPLRDKHGGLIDGEGKKMDRWNEHFTSVFDIISHAVGSTDGVIHPSDWEGIDLDVFKRDCVPDVEEWARIICLLANNKAADRNGTVSEMLRLLGKGSLFQLAAVMNEMWLYKVRPEAWGTFDIVPIYKGKGDKSVCDNYRPISIIDIYSKAFGTLLKQRVDNIIDGRLLEAQAGFRRGRSCQDMTFVMRMLRGYSKEMKRKLYSCFIDLLRHMTQLIVMLYGRC
jgi:hypothetical protein